jgi:hypothetical protein
MLGPCKEGLVAGAIGTCRGGLDMGADAGMETPALPHREAAVRSLAGCVAGEGGLSRWRHRDDASRDCGLRRMPALQEAEGQRRRLHATLWEKYEE